MSSRRLGGGRVLGSGKGLAPPAPPAHHRSSSLLSQTESTVSRDSENSSPFATTPVPEAGDDLGSRVQLGSRGTVTAASSRLVCPICNEEMMTLLQLNRHLDDNHQELPEVQQDEVKTWFNKQVVKAKRFQPLAVINQKLKGLDVFESNDAPTSVLVTPAPSTSRTNTPEVSRPDADEVVSRTHWQRSGYNDICTEPACGKRLGSVNGNINCRKCGRLFCEDHTMYQMKLSRSAQHEPVRGYWCRVCETCYKSRDGYNDHTGLLRDDTSNFLAMRRKTVDRTYLEISRLEKRLTKLTQLLTTPEAELNGSILSMTGQNNQRKVIEQSVVTWEEDSKISKCPFCRQEFGTWSFRRHHCRLCGRVVCADPRTACSSEVGLNVAAATTSPQTEKPNGTTLDIRMCRDCKSTIFSKKDFAMELLHPPQCVRAYENLLQFERGIRLLMPNFQRLLLALQDLDTPPTAAQLSEASKVRKRLIDSFGKYDIAAKRIRDLPTKNDTEMRLQKAIYQQASNFLHLHMLPLKTLPRILKHASPNGHPTTPHASRASLLRTATDATETSSQTSSQVSVLEAEEKELRERLIVLEEQKFFVEGMIDDARKHRRFDEVETLRGNLEELGREIDGVQGMVGELSRQYENVYT